MAGFATEAALRAALDGHNVFHDTYQRSFNSTLNGNLESGWIVGVRPPAGANPATTPGTAYTNAVGGITFPDLSPLRKYLTELSVVSFDRTETQTMFWWDRLVGVSGIAFNSTGDKTINSTTLPRYTTGEGVQVYLEITTAGTTTIPVVSMNSYTNQAGTGGRAGPSITFPSNSFGASGLVGPMPLQAGDWGVKSVETINVSVAGGGSGVLNVILVKPLVMLGYRTLDSEVSERLSPFPFFAPVRILDGATIMVVDHATFSGSPTVEGTYTVVFG